MTGIKVTFEWLGYNLCQILSIYNEVKRRIL